MMERDGDFISNKAFDGTFLLWRKEARGLSKKLGGKGIPRFAHNTRAAAEKEAARLLDEYPQSTFVILQEVGRVKIKADAA